MQQGTVTSCGACETAGVHDSACRMARELLQGSDGSSCPVAMMIDKALLADCLLHHAMYTSTLHHQNLLIMTVYRQTGLQV